MNDVIPFPAVDLDMAEAFVEALGDRHTFQLFRDRADEGGQRGFAQIFHGALRDTPFDDSDKTLSAHFDAMNRKGYGVHVTVNGTDGQGRRLENIVRPRAIAMDFDGVENPRGAGALLPSLVVASRRGPHVYWLLDDSEADLDRWSRCQGALARKLEADLECRAANKTMRIPGFMHQKRDPFLVQMQLCRPDRRYTIEQVVDAWKLDLTPPPPPRPVANLDTIGSDRRSQRCRAFIDRCEPAISGQGGFARTKGICGIGGDFGLEPDEFWPILLDWNSRCVPPWKEEELERKLRRVHDLRTEPFGWRLNENPKKWGRTIKIEGPMPDDLFDRSPVLYVQGTTAHLDEDVPIEAGTKRRVYRDFGSPPDDHDAPWPDRRPGEQSHQNASASSDFDLGAPPDDHDVPWPDRRPGEQSHRGPAGPPPDDHDGPAFGHGPPSSPAEQPVRSSGNGGDPPRRVGGNGGDTGGPGQGPPLRLVGTAADGYVMSDLGNAKRWIAQMNQSGTQVAHCELWGKWLYWDGHRWSVDMSNHIRSLVERSVQTMHALNPLTPEGEEQKALRRFIQQSESQRGFDHCLGQARHLVPVQPDDLDQNQWLFNAADGTIDLRTGEVFAPRRSDLITKRSEIAYGHPEESDCPMWTDFLHMVMGGDEELIRFLQMAAGYTLTGRTSEQCFFLLSGRGKNGKSTFLETLARIMGDDYAGTAPIDSFLERRYEAIRNDLAGMKGRRMVSAIEANQGSQLDEALVKSITGGDKISARFLRAEFFEFRPEFKLWLGVNERPRIRGDDEGIWRRVRLVPFEVEIPPQKRILDFGQKLVDAGEMTAILRWAVRGCQMWLDEGSLQSPARIIEATASYREEQDVLGSWLRSRCTVGGTFQVASSVAYKDYREWAAESGHRPMALQTWSRKVAERGFEHVRKNSGRFFRGLGLLSTRGEQTGFE